LKKKAFLQVLIDRCCFLLRPKQNGGLLGPKKSKKKPFFPKKNTFSKKKTLF